MSEQNGRVVVTGGGSGMGRACAAAFAEAGAEVAILGRTEETLRAAAQELGQRIWWIQADVSRRGDVERAVAAILARHGHVDVLVNAAGFARGVAADTPLDAAERDWDATVGANLKGAFLMAIALAPHLTRPGGRIINISSIAAYTGGSRRGPPPYPPPKPRLHPLPMALPPHPPPPRI